jgi:heme/copper-type cytochrome/quinol oxidase subunit 2
MKWFAILTFLLSALLVMFVPSPHSASMPADRLIKIEAAQFVFSPGNIQVNPGDRVTLEVTATDVVHGLYLDGYGLSIIANPGQTARMQFVADRVGSFRFRCSVACGDMHPFMIGKLQVGPNWMLWRGFALAVLTGVSGFFITSRQMKWI